MVSSGAKTDVYFVPKQCPNVFNSLSLERPSSDEESLTCQAVGSDGGILLSFVKLCNTERNGLKPNLSSRSESCCLPHPHNAVLEQRLSYECAWVSDVPGRSMSEKLTLLSSSNGQVDPTCATEAL